MINNQFYHYEITSEEAKELICTVDFIVLPVGSIEQHSRHLPLGTDIIIAENVAKEVMIRAKDEKISLLVMPPVYYGYSDEHKEFPGTISIRGSVLIDYLYDICASLARQGAKRIFIINGHGGNMGVLDIVSKRIGTDFGIFVFYSSPYTSEMDKVLESDIGGIGHAGEFETSVMLHIRPDLVRANKMIKEIPKQLESVGTDPRKSNEVNFNWFRLKSIMTESGVVGDPTKSNSDKGRRLIDMMANRIVRIMKELKKITTLKE